MCVALAPALLIASTAMTAAGTVMGGIQAKQQGDYQAAVAKQNEQLAVDARRDAINRGEQAQVLEGRKQAQLQGQQRVALAGSGVDTFFGTAADLAADTAMIGSENQQTIMRNYQREAMGYGVNAMNDRAEGAAAKAQGSNALINSLFSAGGTILGGASQVNKSLTAQKLGTSGTANIASYAPVALRSSPTFNY